MENLNQFAVPAVNTQPQFVAQHCKHFLLPEDPTGGIGFAEINEHALARFEDVIDWLDLDGKEVGKEFKFLNPKRNDAEIGSCSVNTETGQWSDFALDDARGGDLISLVAYLKDVSQSEAAKVLFGLLEEQETDVVPSSKPVPKKSMPATNLTLVMPIPENAPPPPETFGALGSSISTYRYLDAEGRLSFAVLRFDQANGRKEFRPMTLWCDPQGQQKWQMKAPPAPRPLYGLEQLHARHVAPVLVVEGEKAANAAAQLFPDHVVVTTMNGAQSPDKSDLSPLMGREVYIWADHDEPGQKYAEAITSMIRQQNSAAPVSIMQPLVVSPDNDAGGNPILEPGFVAPKGWDAADAVEMGWTAEHIQLLPADMFVPVPVDTSYYTADNHYYVSDAGVFSVRYVKGEMVKTLVCSRIDVVAQTRNKHGKDWGTHILVTDPDKSQHVWAMPNNVFSKPTELRATLLSMGAFLPQSSDRSDALIDYLSGVKPETRALCVAHPGWHGDVFVLPNRIVGTSKDRVVFQTDDPTGCDIYKQRGTLAEWQQHVALPCQANSRLIFSICAALAGPSLSLLGEENGGFHFVGGSSIGKTTVLRVAASVWGGPDFLQTWRNTDNALEAIAQRYNDCMLPMDEMNQAEADKVGSIAYMLGNGQGKGRSTKTCVIRPVSTWRLIFLSTGEVGLAEYAASANQRPMAGQEVRLVSLPANPGTGFGIFDTIHDAPSAQEFAERFRANVGDYFGHAGPAFVTVLANPLLRDKCLNAIRSDRELFIQNFVPAGVCGQVSRVAKRFALVAAIGEQAIRHGILPWQEGEAMAAVRNCFNAWLDSRGGVGNQEASQAIAHVRHFIELHGESRFRAWDNHSDNNGDGRTVNRAGFRRVIDGVGTEYYVLPQVFKNDICRGLNPTEVAKALTDAGLLVTPSNGKTTKSVRLPGLANTTRVYHLSSAILSEEPQG